jgi:hypothetical protein
MPKFGVERYRQDQETYLKLVWKPIRGFPGYAASMCGQIARIAPAKTHPTPRILKQRKTAQGYYRCKLLQGSTKKDVFVHRLVLLAWVGFPPFAEYQGCHNDGNPTNNHYTNLRWDTCKGNLSDRIKHGTTLDADRNGRAKLTWDQVRSMRNDFAQGGHTVAHLSRKYQIAYSQASEIIRKESWWPDGQGTRPRKIDIPPIIPVVE